MNLWKSSPKAWLRARMQSAYVSEAGLRPTHEVLGLKYWEARSTSCLVPFLQDRLILFLPKAARIQPQQRLRGIFHVYVTFYRNAGADVALHSVGTILDAPV